MNAAPNDRSVQRAPENRTTLLRHIRQINSDVGAMRNALAQMDHDVRRIGSSALLMFWLTIVVMLAGIAIIGVIAL